MPATPGSCGSATAAGNGQTGRQVSPTSGLEVADGEHGDGLGLTMLYPDPTAGVLVRKAVAQWLQFCSLDCCDKGARGEFGESAEAAAGSDAVRGFARAGTSPGSPGCRCLFLNRHVWWESKLLPPGASPVVARSFAFTVTVTPPCQPLF